MASAPLDPVWLGSADAARQLGITPRTLYRLISEGELPGYKIGRVLRIKLADIEAFLESARVQPGDLEHLYPSRTNETDAAET